jgi:hypothetical protein
MSEGASKGVERLSRPLSPQERDLVRWLIEHSHIDAGHLLPQIDRMTVAGKCNCGCPTIYFALDGESVTRKGEQLISDWIAKVDGDLVGVMLFQTNGQISSMEVYSCAGTYKPFGLPAIDTIMGYENVPER